ncbi:ABC transporter permease [Actinoplanes sp. NPDC051851]|uniref:ABC transporter permease n=1 Tax=Actinoplanes sp. NPDC051851 TaxID=3154753 RepID=UPI003447FCD2
MTATARRRGLPRVVRSILRSRSATIGFGLVLLHVLLALLAPVLAQHDPVVNDPNAVLQLPGGAYPLGTDTLGRDILSRTLYGGRYALTTSLTATAIVVLLGTVIAGLAAFYGGWLDDLITRVLDSVLAVPAILSLLVVVTVFGSGTWVLIMAIVVVYTGGVIRIVRAAAMDVLPRDYVTAARARGEGVWYILAREVLPNILDVVLVEFAMRASWVLLLISSLSFLGFGANPPTPDWGLMVAENRSLMALVPLATVAPMVSLATLIVGLNLASDGLAKSLGVDRMKEIVG